MSLLRLSTLSAFSLLFLGSAFAQTGIVTGRIRDNGGGVLQGARIDVWPIDMRGW